MNCGHTPGRALRPYRVSCAGLEYIALATSAGMACIDAMELHGVAAASARPLEVQPC